MAGGRNWEQEAQIPAGHPPCIRGGHPRIQARAFDLLRAPRARGTSAALLKLRAIPSKAKEKPRESGVFFLPTEAGAQNAAPYPEATMVFCSASETRRLPATIWRLFMATWTGPIMAPR